MQHITPSEIGSQDVSLSEYDELSRRQYLVELASRYCGSKVGDDAFKEICQGRAEPMAEAGRLFSTCGEWAMFLLQRMGYRGDILNRDLTGAKPRKWLAGRNIEYLLVRGRLNKAFVEYLLSKQKDRRPMPGDIVYVANQGDPRTEHVFMLKCADKNPYGGPEIWTSVDGGQGGITSQHIAECRRIFVQSTGKVHGVKDTEEGPVPTGEGRKVVGWLNIGALSLSVPANFR